MSHQDLTNARQAAIKAAEARQDRDHAIRFASLQGESIRAIATAVGMSSARIHQILHGR